LKTFLEQSFNKKKYLFANLLKYKNLLSDKRFTKTKKNLKTTDEYLGSRQKSANFSTTGEGARMIQADGFKRWHHNIFGPGGSGWPALRQSLNVPPAGQGFPSLWANAGPARHLAPWRKSGAR
jgi:hypothetical protein